MKTFPRLYRDYVARYNLTHDLYAIPRIDKKPEEYAIQYKGLDRDALVDNDQSDKLAEIRMAELNKIGKSTDGFLFEYEDALDVYNCLTEKQDYEVIWTRTAHSSVMPPSGFSSVGFEPTYFGGDHFAAQCDCMLFPRWHGTDDEGTLFKDYFLKLNGHGLFKTPQVASEFLKYYLSFDWTERDEYVIGEVFISQR